MLDFEFDYFGKELPLIAGIDEAGRGPLAGPVSACAYIPDFSCRLERVNDSKKLSDKARRELYSELTEKAICFKSVLIDEKEIDAINILNATKKAMKESLSFLFPIPEVVLIDAVRLDLPVKSLSIIKGDEKSYAIAAASIIAKVERDDYMLRQSELYPEYGFEKNKGYGTRHHIEMIKKYGPCPIHRVSFLKKVLSNG